MRRREGALLLAFLLAPVLEPHAAAVPQDAEGHAAAPGTLEGRPRATELSPLQAVVDAASAGGRVEVGPGAYRGDLYLDRPLHLVGKGRPRLLGAGRGSVVRVRAAGVTIEGFEIDGGDRGDLGRDTAGVHVAAPRATVRDCTIVGTIFGIYLREAHGAVVENCTIRGIRGLDPGEKGSGIHVWNTDGFRLTGNDIRDVRDGFYIQSSPRGEVRGNVARDLRYGLHYMFSDDNVFEDNVFANGAAGTALMYSKRLTFRRNSFVANRGFASVGLLFKTCDDVVAEDNLVADNARGIFLEGSYRNVFRRNVVAASDSAIVLYDSCGENRFEGNSFVGNMTPLELVGKRTDTVFEGNYWSGYDGLDLDGDGHGDRPFRLSTAFDHLRGNIAAADLLSRSAAAAALGLAERLFPVLQPIPVEDPRPLVRPPVLAGVPAALPQRDGSRGRVSGALVSLFLCAAGVALGARALRPSGGRRR